MPKDILCLEDWYPQGSGAREWAVTHDVQVCQARSLITERARQVHEQSVSYIRQLREQNGKKRKFDQPEDLEIQAGLLDTVGAVGVDAEGNVAGAVSSGGLLLKHAGRVGQAAVYGCGCWAQNDFDGSGVNLAVSTSGCGEHLVRTMFGKLCAQATLATDPLGGDLARDIQQKFLDSVFLRDIDSPMAGSLSLRHDPAAGTTDLFWLHTTRSMGVAYTAAGKDKVQALFSELSPDRVGRTVAVNCKSFAAESDDPTEEGDQEEEDSNQPPEEVPTTSSAGSDSKGEPATKEGSSV